MITKADILAVVDPTIVASKNEAAIAEAFSVGRTKLVKTEIGIGTVLDVMGLAAGNAFLEFIFTNNDFRYVKEIVKEGKLDLALSSVRTHIDTLVAGGVIPTDAAENLKNLAVVEDKISSYEVASAFERG